MAKIRLNPRIATHRKLYHLAAELKVRRAQALGHLAFLWVWAVANAQAGDLIRFSDRTIAQAADWHGRPSRFVTALRRAGWLDGSQLHQWRYGEELAKARAVQRERHLVRRHRIIARDGMICGICRGAIESMSDLHIDHIVPRSRGGSSEPDNLQPSHALCNLRKGARC